MTRRTRFLVCGVLLCFLVSPASEAKKRPDTVTVSRPPISPVTPAAATWAKYCGNLEMTGVAQDALINPGSVRGLVLLWARSLQDAIASQPTVSQDRVFIGDWSGTEYSLDVSTGVILATADLGRTLADQCTPASLGITSAAALAGDTLYLAGGDDGFYALDADTLAVRWKTSLGDNSALGGYYGWCSPSVVEGQVLQGVSSNCDNPFVPGRLVAFDPVTGEISQEADFVPPGLVGSGVWTSPAVDLPARKVFVTTASAIQFDDGLAYCIVRVSLDGLSIEDSWRVDPGNVEDADWGSSPTLFVDGDGRRLVGAGQKDGFYYAFLRDDLAQGPVWRTPLARGGSCPQCCDGTLSTAAFDGLRLYAGAGAPPGADPARAVGTVSALDPTTGDILWTYTIEGGPVIAPITFVNGVVFAAGAFKVVALSSATGEELWSSPAPAGFYGGVAVANGKVFVGDTYGNLYAFGFSPEPPPVVRTGQNR